VLSLETSGNHIIYFPPIQQSTSEPIILRLRGGHFTLLRSTSAGDFLKAILPSLPHSSLFHYINTDSHTLPPIVRLLSISSSIESLEDLKSTHALSHLDIVYSSSRTLSQSMECISTHQHDNYSLNRDTVNLVNPNQLHHPHAITIPCNLVLLLVNHLRSIPKLILAHLLTKHVDVTIIDLLPL
jgi:hypothetical protein